MKSIYEQCVKLQCFEIEASIKIHENGILMDRLAENEYITLLQPRKGIVCLFGCQEHFSCSHYIDHTFEQSRNA